MRRGQSSPAVSVASVVGYPAGGTTEVPGTHPHLERAVRGALSDPDGVRGELLAGIAGGRARHGHLCANAWVFSPDLTRVLLVRHPRFSWTAPGGHLNPGELPERAAARELVEEAGLVLEPCLEVPVALVATPIPESAGGPSHVHYCCSYVFVADDAEALSGEAGQPVAWFRLSEALPEGYFGDNWTAREHRAALVSRGDRTRAGEPGQ